MYAVTAFGEFSYAEPIPTRFPPGGGGGVHGGSGFPADWFERMGIALDQGDLDERELQELLALGFLD